MTDESNTLTDIQGTVKWFDPRKGYGFIVGPQGQDIFVHYSVIDGDGFRVLTDGSSVVYSAQNSDKGWRATACARAESKDTDDAETPEVVVAKRTYSRTPRR